MKFLENIYYRMWCVDSLWVEVIEDSIHAMGTFCSWGTLTYSSLFLSPSWGELLSPGGAIAFCASDFGGGMTGALGGSLLSNVKHKITNTVFGKGVISNYLLLTFPFQHGWCFSLVGVSAET